MSQSAAQKSLNPRRKPAQDRSKKRVDAILAAARSLISEKGINALKINQIASRAGVTAGSIYQYFPDKHSIIQALANNMMDNIYKMLEASLPELSSKEECYLLLRSLIDQIYLIYLNDPGLRDLWVCMYADKNMQHMDVVDSRRHAELVMECIKRFYPESLWEKLFTMCFMMAHLTGSAVRMALSVKPEEGRAIIDAFKGMIKPDLIENMS